MQAKKKKVIIAITAILIAAILVIIAVFVGFCIYLHIKSSQRETLIESALSDGPWGKQAIWETDDGQAYLLSQKTGAETIAAYFYINETWYKFQVDMTYGSLLIFADEADTEKFTGEFDIEDHVFTVKNLNASNGDENIPKHDTYVFSEVANYDELISKLPFDT